MEDLIYNVLGTYGDRALLLILSLLGLAGVRLLVALGTGTAMRNLFGLLARHARDVVVEVGHTYVAALQAGRADGVLTEAEKAEAKAKAMRRLREKLGWRTLLQLGGGLLPALLGLFGASGWTKRIEGWLSGALETQLAELKVAGLAPSAGGKGGVVPLPLPAPPGDARPI